jgi:sugar/nucleoside kinase (ribokinase family)
VQPIVVVGNLTLDDTVTERETFPGAAGGDALYAALGARLWGMPVAILSRVGDDYPQSHLRRMREVGIDVSGVRSLPGPTVHYRVTYRGDERTFEHLTQAERLDQLSPQAHELDAIAAARWMHVAAMPIGRQAAAVERARDAGVPYSLDPHEEYVVGFEEQLRGLMRGGVFLPSELEAGLLCPGVPSRIALQQFEGWGVTAAAIKLGSKGSSLRLRGQAVRVRALPVDVVDPTGAGDAYCGGFVAGFLATRSTLAAAACGTISAAHIIQGFGAFASPPPPAHWIREGLSALLTGRFGGEGDRQLAALQQAFGPRLHDPEGAGR